MATKGEINPGIYSFEKGGILTKWLGELRDIRNNSDEWLGVTLISSRRRPEGVKVAVSKGSRVIGERGTVVRSGKSGILVKEGFRVINARTGERLAEVVFSENPNSSLLHSDLE